MAITHIAKNPAVMSLPSGESYLFWNDYPPTISSKNFTTVGGSTVIYTFTAPGGSTRYRMLLFRKFSPFNILENSNVYNPVFYNDKTDLTEVVINPIYECMSPSVVPNPSGGGATLTFWTNMIDSYTSSTPYKYDKVFRFEENNLDTVSNSYTYRRCLFTCAIYFFQYNVGGTIQIYPICTLPKCIFIYNETYPVTDFGAGGGGGGSIPAKIASKDGAFYNCELYANGVNLPSTGNAKVYVLQLNFSDTLPNGTWIIATPSSMEIVGGENVV